MKRPAITLDHLRSGFLALLLMLAGAGGAPAVAHPHAWIDLRSTVVLDAAGRVIAIEQEWLFDQFYTVLVTEELSGAAGTRAEALKALARSNLQNLRSYDYFTEVHAGGTKVPLGTVSEFESELRKGRLWMRFVVPLATPIDPTERALAFAIFDPTYYIEMLHLPGDMIAFRGAGAGGCFGRIVPPNPTTETVLLAQAMDRNATPDATLGSVFAERVEVTCR
jgi:ABC-type uncharacterized transport system substrate-binding protein